MKPCPFCGTTVDLSDDDTLYPNGTGWIQEDGYRSYHRVSGVPKSQWCWSMHCNVTRGGCGASISGDTREETIEKWESRVNKDNIT